LEAHPEQRLAIARRLLRKRTAHWVATRITRSLGPEAAAQVDREQREIRRLERLARRSAQHGRGARGRVAAQRTPARSSPGWHRM
jgi:ABC-type nitrate/sulfonate/bicarbonate transport system substrate-binding protein